MFFIAWPGGKGHQSYPGWGRQIASRRPVWLYHDFNISLNNLVRYSLKLQSKNGLGCNSAAEGLLNTLVFYSFGGINILTKHNLEMKKFISPYRLYSLSSQESQGRNSREELEAETLEGHCFLACSHCLDFSFLVQSNTYPLTKGEHSLQ